MEYGIIHQDRKPQRFDKIKIIEFSLIHVRFEMPVKYLNGNVR